MVYEVRTTVFEGPFDLLLHLILREQLDIYEVSLRDIVDAYLREIERMEQLDLEIATEFLLIAATLVELKTRRLLPGDDDMDLDEELALWEERDLLLGRLLECKTFKDVAQVFRRLHDENARVYPRVMGVDERYVEIAPDLLEGMTAFDVRQAFLRAVVPKPIPPIDLDHVAPIRASVADAFEELVHELPGLGRASFHELTCSLVDRIAVIVRFLAILELFKQGLVELEQLSTFGEIVGVWHGDNGDVGDLAAVDPYDC